MHFSLIPPTGRTSPYKLTSPVMAKSDLTLLAVIRETKATVIVTPALGPSLGVAAAGKWTCKSKFFNKLLTIDLSFSMLLSVSRTSKLLVDLIIPIELALVWIQLILVLIDSRMTSPSLPVNLIYPEPGYFVVSTRRALPPIVVYARPIATPGIVIFSLIKCSYFFLPRASSIILELTLTF